MQLTDKHLVAKRIYEAFKEHGDMTRAEVQAATDCTTYQASTWIPMLVQGGVLAEHDTGKKKHGRSIMRYSLIGTVEFCEPQDDTVYRRRDKAGPNPKFRQVIRRAQQLQQEFGPSVFAVLVAQMEAAR